MNSIKSYYGYKPYLLCLFVIIPMPIAGGIKYLVPTALILLLLAVREIFSKNKKIRSELRGVLVAAFMLLFWEVISGIAASGLNDTLYILARFLWLVLGISYCLFLCEPHHAGRVQSMDIVLLGSLILLLIAMAYGSLYHPEWTLGRSFGGFTIPVARSTGVPQSDGKLGVLMTVASAFFFIKWIMTKRMRYFAGGLIAFLPIIFTQSRSTLLAFAVSYVFILLLVVRVDTRKTYRVAAFFVLVAILSTAVAFGGEIYEMLSGEGIYKANVEARSLGLDYGISVLADNLLLGAGASSIHVEGHGFGVHNTFFALAVKSGIVALIMFALFFVLSASAFFSLDIGRGSILTALAIISGPLVEHWNYPGLFNEHLWLVPTSLVSLYTFSSGQFAVRSNQPEVGLRQNHV